MDKDEMKRLANRRRFQYDREVREKLRNKTTSLTRKHPIKAF